MGLKMKGKERKLLLYSNIISDYADIKKILEDNQRITDELIEGLPAQQKHFFNNILPGVLKQAINEWKGNPNIQDDDLGPVDRMPCSLDNQPNRFIFHICNDINGECLNVGSECIKHFFDGKLKAHFPLQGKSYLKLDKQVFKKSFVRQF